MVEDSFNNRVIVSGSRTGRAAFRRFVRDLDVPTTQQGGVEVIYLNYSSAEDIKVILDGMLQSETFLKLAGEASAADSGSGSSFTIQADTANNAIVIAASASVIGEVENVVRKLDRRRPQVLIEAIIANVSQDVAREITSELASVGRSSGGLVTSFDGLLTSLLGSLGDFALSDDSSVSASAALGSIGNGVVGGVGNFDSDSGEGWALLIEALASDTNTTILSTPSVLTLDNEEANLSVGQEVPFVTGSFTSDVGDSTNPFQTIEREEVGVVLTVTPQINNANTVQLDIAQEISSIASAVVDGISDVITDKSTIETHVMVEDQELLVLGGLMQDSETDTQTKVPILGDIPLLGLLFRGDSKSKGQDVLMMFIRPTIIRTSEDARGVSSKRFDYLREFHLDENDEAIDLRKEIFNIFESESNADDIDADAGVGVD